jgi:hypothetical protein
MVGIDALVVCSWLAFAGAEVATTGFAVWASAVKSEEE